MKNLDSIAKYLCERINLANYKFLENEEILVKVEDLNTLKDYIKLLEGRVLGLEKIADEKEKKINNLTSQILRGQKTYKKLSELN